MKNISSRQTSLPSMPSTRRLVYQGIIYRFRFLLVATLVCAASTIAAYIMGQLIDGHWQLDDMSDDVASSPIEWTSAMYTSVYAMWNCYVLILCILYAPSHKHVSEQMNNLHLNFFH